MIRKFFENELENFEVKMNLHKYHVLNYIAFCHVGKNELKIFWLLGDDAVFLGKYRFGNILNVFWNYNVLFWLYLQRFFFS